MSEPKLNMILARDGAGAFQLWACRGHGKGCKRNLFRKSTKPCDDCMGPLPPTVTIGEVYRRMQKGDA
jgi:hypothetical protein